MDDEKLIARFKSRHHFYDEFWEKQKKPRRYNGEGSIRKKGNGYEARAYINGVRKSVYARTKKEVLEKLKNLQLQPLEEEKPSNAPSCPTLVDWLDIWLNEYHKNYSDASRKKYTHYIDNISTTDFGNKQLTDITSLDLQRFINNFTSREMASRYLGVLKQAYALAIDNGYASKNPAANVVVNTERTAPKFKDNEKAFTVSEEKAFVEAIVNNKYRVLYLLSLYAGLRRGEVCSLTWEDIDLTAKIISINKSAKRSFDGGYTIGKTKTLSSVRTVPIQPILYNILLPLRSSGLVFNNNDKPLNADILTMDFADIMKELNQKHTFHQLRHTFATRCYEKGVNPKAVQIWLGHSSLEMTTGTYTHATSDLIENELKKL